LPLAQKIPLAPSLNTIATKQAHDEIWRQGKALPCSVASVNGSIVTVKFELTGPFTLPLVTMPVLGCEYIRYPIQIGDKGVTFPADIYLGGVTGLGGGTADMTVPQANLSNLVFVPVGNKNWAAPDDPNAVCIYGPDGVRLRDTGSTVVVVIHGGSVAITGNLTVSGIITAHGYVTAG
jgi:hypothetical protein